MPPPPFGRGAATKLSVSWVVLGEGERDRERVGLVGVLGRGRMKEGEGAVGEGEESAADEDEGKRGGGETPAALRLSSF